ncbi:MAG: dTDP-4-dehydrorhamnose 3,5-epimerase [Limnothrix sp. CACIAM 69d]|nr:MAG: dTDP-4-dehydrorhamnose 3,5-epimerase [Limnothrix sp. CACIAM 69d]
MGLSQTIQVKRLDSMKSGMAEFYTPQSCHETMLVQVPAMARDDLFVHRFQTDQLLVVRGNFVMVVLQNRRYQYIPLSDRVPVVLTIPPGVPHGALNFSQNPCLVVNAVVRHGAAHRLDYRPMKPPFPYDLAVAEQSLAALLNCVEAAA